MKLIIDIPDNIYYAIKITQPFISGRISGKTYLQILVNSVQNGTPLDDVKAEIAEEICLTDNPYTKETKYTIEHLKLLEILDNIGKADMRGE